MESELTKSLSMEDLAKMRKQFKDNPSFITMIDGVIAIRLAELAEAKLVEDFKAKVIELTSAMPKPPANVYNIYLAYAEVDDTSKAQVEVEVAGVKELRYPKVTRWIAETNKATGNAKSSTSGTIAKSTKREISIYQHNPNGADTLIGVYPNYQKFAEAKAIKVGTDSARRAVERDGYYGIPTTS